MVHIFLLGRLDTQWYRRLSDLSTTYPDVGAIITLKNSEISKTEPNPDLIFIDSAVFSPPTLNIIIPKIKKIYPGIPIMILCDNEPEWQDGRLYFRLGVMDVIPFAMPTHDLFHTIQNILPLKLN